MKTKTIKQIGIIVNGTATLNLWGGGTGIIEMESYFLPNDKITKDNILHCVNDNGFGCESISHAEIDISIKYDNGSVEYDRTIETGLKQHISLFLGWSKLRDKGIAC